MIMSAPNPVEIIEGEQPTQLEMFEPAEIIRPDINIGKWAGWIFSSPWSKDLYNSKVKSWEAEFEGERVEASIAVQPIKDRKRPTTSTYKVYLALIQIWEESGTPENGVICFSSRLLAHTLNMKWCGRSTANFINEHLDILKGTLITWNYAFENSEYRDDTARDMNLISEKEYYQRSQIRKKLRFTQMQRVELNRRFVENMLQGKTKPVNYHAFISIKNDSCASLYALLDIYLSGKRRWRRRALGLLTEELEYEGSRYEKKFNRHAKLKEFVKELDGKELSNGKLRLWIEPTADRSDYNLVAEKTPRIPPKKRIPPKLANPEEDIPFIVDDIVQGLHDTFRVPVKPDSRKTFAILARWYDRRLLFNALALVKADMRDSAKSPVKAFMYQVHVMAHERKLRWINECGDGCPWRPENRKKSLV